MKALVIINPKAGKSNHRNTAEFLRRAFRLHGYDCDIMMTKEPREAESIARSMAENYRIVVCSGGDGTLNETVNGLSCVQNRPPIAYLPAGTTNDFAGSLGLSTNPSQAVHDIFNGTAQKLDIGRMNDRCFVYVASFGAFSDSSFQTPQEMKNRFGRLAYIMESIREMPSIKSHRVKVFDSRGEICSGSYIFGAVSNATTLGGILHYSSSYVSLSDGMHEVILVRKPESLGMLRRIIRAVIKKNYDADGIEMFHASHVRFESEDEIAWTLDGERCDPTKITDITNVREAVEFIVPKQSLCRESSEQNKSAE